MRNKSSVLYYWIKMCGGTGWYYCLLLVCCVFLKQPGILFYLAMGSVMQTAVKFLYAETFRPDYTYGLLYTLPFSRKEIFDTYIGVFCLQCLALTITASLHYLEQPIIVCLNVLLMLVVYIACVFLPNYPGLSMIASAGALIFACLLLLPVIIQVLRYPAGAAGRYTNAESVWICVLAVIDLFLFAVAILETILQRKQFLDRRAGRRAKC